MSPRPRRTLELRDGTEPPTTAPPPARPRWSIDGYPADVLIWTRAEFSRLAERPPDAQRYPGELYVLLVVR